MSTAPWICFRRIHAVVIVWCWRSTIFLHRQTAVKVGVARAAVAVFFGTYNRSSYRQDTSALLVLLSAFSAMARPQGTDGTDYHYRQRIDTRYTSIINARTVLRNVLIVRLLSLPAVYAFENFYPEVPLIASPLTRVALLALLAAAGFFELLIAIVKSSSRAVLSLYTILCSISMLACIWCAGHVARSGLKGIEDNPGPLSALILTVVLSLCHVLGIVKALSIQNAVSNQNTKKKS